MRVNGLSELGDLPGNIGSGVYANWAADKYRIKMKVDIQNLPGNSTQAHDNHKKRIANNGQRRTKAANKFLAEMNPRIGNGNPSPTIGEFARNSSRPLWTRRFFNGGGPRGGAQTYVIEIPTNQTHLYHQQKQINYYDVSDGSIIFTIIFIFVGLVKKTRYRFHKMKIKLSSLFNRAKSKFKRNLTRNN